MRNINNKTSHIETGKIVAYSDMKKIIKEVQREVEKDSQYAWEASAIVIAIKKEIETSTIIISLEYSNTKVRDDISF